MDKGFSGLGAKKAGSGCVKISQPGGPTHGINSTINGRQMVGGGFN
uniref:DNA polymerase III subunit n=1 Tax=Phaeodactylum tricornutum TaxID=2850 RepID=A0A172E709_PHATR|nr:DNA polymerase III subunit [Phaeodactylum tricornutum]